MQGIQMVKKYIADTNCSLPNSKSMDVDTRRIIIEFGEQTLSPIEFYIIINAMVSM